MFPEQYLPREVPMSEPETFTTVYVTTRFTGFHRWKDAPDEVDYLRHWHRHVFHVRLDVPVSHDNRDVEFIQLKQKVGQFIHDNYSMRQFEASCETIARVLLDQFNAWKVEVSEDGENGATVYRKLLNVREAKDVLPRDELKDILDKANAVWRGQMGGVAVSSDSAPPVPPVGTDKRVEEVLKVRAVPFYGFEVEGPNVGRPTLFVPGGCRPRVLIDAWNDFVDEANEAGLYESDFQVYLGAGNDRKVNHDTLRVAIQLFGVKKVVVEVDKVADVMCPDHLDQFVKGGGTVVTLSSTDYARYRPLRIWRKIVVEETKKVIVITHAGRYESSLVDPEYGQDVTDAASFVRRLLARKVEAAR